MNLTMLAIIGIMGGVICAIGDLFLDLKGSDNIKLGKLKIIDSKWEEMPHYRFLTSTILGMFAIPMYCCGILALAALMAEKAPCFAIWFKSITIIGAMGGFLIHTFLNLCPTMYQIIKKEAGFDLAEKVIGATFKQIYVPFFLCYIMLVIVSSGMVVYAIISGVLGAPLWSVLLNPVVFQIVGILLRATKLKCFIDAPSCCAASLGLASFGVIALIVI